MSAKHCGQGDCRSLEGLCACACADCRHALDCKHEDTVLSMGSMTPFMPELRFDLGHGRTKLEDGTDYVGPTMTVRPRRPDEPIPQPYSWSREVCLDCGMTVRRIE